MVNTKYHKKYLWFIFGLALAIRFGFIILGAKITPQISLFINGDSDSYALSIINFLERGIYSFDLGNPDAAFGRLPGYPVFWGLHYIIFKQNAYLAVAITQALLDAILVFFLYNIANRLKLNSWFSLSLGLIYALYIFSVFWVPITGTESLAIFVTILFLNILSKENYHSLKWYICLGLCAAIGFYIREYLGILFFLSGIYFLLLVIKKKLPFKYLLVYGVSFTALYVLWPIRNYVFHDRVEFLKPVTAGYERYGKDIAAFRSWMYTWHTDVEPYMSRIMQKEDPKFPSFISSDPQLSANINHLLDTAMVCGSSFYYWKHNARLEGAQCNNYIADGFDSLKKVFIKRYPLKYYLQVPSLNLKKALFKNGLSSEQSKPLLRILFSLLFGWRSLLIILGFAGIFFLPRNIFGFVVGTFPVFMYLFISCILRQVEMRYLLQADVVLLIPAIFFLHHLYYYFIGKKHMWVANNSIQELSEIEV